MKFRSTFSLGDGVVDCYIAECKETLKYWAWDGQFLTVEFDTEKKTATIISVAQQNEEDEDEDQSRIDFIDFPDDGEDEYLWEDEPKIGPIVEDPDRWLDEEPPPTGINGN